MSLSIGMQGRRRGRRSRGEDSEQGYRKEEGWRREEEMMRREQEERRATKANGDSLL